MGLVAVIDYGMSNLRSVAKALDHVAGTKHRVRICSTPEDVGRADCIVFPGQGAIRDCMEDLKRLGLDDAIREAISAKPFLGICLGLQSLMEYSEEGGGTPGLGIFRGRVVRFPAGATDPATGDRLKIPHMGWNQVTQTHTHPLWKDIEQGEPFYFVHSYLVTTDQAEIVAAITTYGVEFASTVARDNVFATQFHPEKSQRAGLRLLSNFLEWDGTGRR